LVVNETAPDASGNKFTAGEDGSLIDECDWIPEGILEVEESLSPGHRLDFIIAREATGIPGAHVYGIEIIKGEIEMLGIRPRVKVIAIRAGIETREDCSAAIKVMTPG
jgi:hypothetical protein